MASKAAPKYTKRPWLPSEDQLLVEAVTSLGAPEFAVKGCEKSGVRWTDIAKVVPDRAAKQCRERWRNHLDPGVSREAWSDAENEILLSRYQEFGSMWAEIASGLPGRADNGCASPHLPPVVAPTELPARPLLFVPCARWRSLSCLLFRCKNQWNKLMGWGSSASRPRKTPAPTPDGESPPKKARRKAPVGSSLGRPAARGEGGAAAGFSGATPGVVQWGMMSGGAVVPAGRPAASGLAGSSAAASATPGAPYLGPDVMTVRCLH